MPDASIVTNLGIAGFALWILMISNKSHAEQMKKKDEDFLLIIERKDKEAAAERVDFTRRLDAAYDAMRKLESDVRNSFATTITDNTNILKEAMIFIAQKRL